MSRGRPSLEEPVRRTKYTQEFIDTDGSVVTWYYDVDKFANGPWKVDVVETVIQESFEEKNARLPKTQRKYFNPENQKWIGYGRAKQLGII